MTAKRMTVDCWQVVNSFAVQLALIEDPEVVAAIRQFTVDPRCEQREWDYRSEGQTFPCWIVIEDSASETCIAYCEQGFGPALPWGLLSNSPHQSMGMDSGWFTFLEDAFRQSPMWSGPDPPNYVVR
jgi:hypothetical protein